MSCCDAIGAAALHSANPNDGAAEILLASRSVGDGIRQTDLSLPGMHCGGCIRIVEDALSALPGVEHARVNLSSKRVAIRWRGEAVPPFIEALDAVGYEAHLHDIDAEEHDPVRHELVRALAVAGFAASNIMMLSVAVWSGADPAARDIFHWLSAVIALPALAYSGRVFFRSAWRVLRRGRTNMDVPISVGVLLAFAMSLYETAIHGEHAYFDAATGLLFFLLIGRTLEHAMRERARRAVTGLVRLAARGAMVQRSDGTRSYLPVEEIEPGMTILLAAGERVPVDARVVAGCSELDCSLVSGEALPQLVAENSAVQAGTLNLTAPLTLAATAAAKDSFLAEVTRLLEAAEASRSHYRRIADRAARLYAPAIHATALLAFAGWVVYAGDIHRALMVSVAVLIITCPCALGLAVPMVQVAAARRLFEHGILVKDGGALERLAEADTVIFDKTGTLTQGTPRLVDRTGGDAALVIAAAMAAGSRHPYSRALAAQRTNPVVLDDLHEHPGSGLEARGGAEIYRLGRADWALADPIAASGMGAGDPPNVVLSADGRILGAFWFTDQLRADAASTVATLKRWAMPVEILSGDRDEPVRRLAAALGIPHIARLTPGGKLDRIAALAASGRKVLMVGDGLNDAPSLAGAYVSMAPASAADVGRNAADFVFLRESLAAVPLAIDIARRAGRLARQNLTLAVVYNVIAVPIAILGQATPLLAAIAMSLSSIIVVANSLRLAPSRSRQSSPPLPATPQATARPASRIVAATADG